MRVHRIRNRLLQFFYRPPMAARRIALPQKTLSFMDDIDKAIEKRITPLLTGLWGK